MHQSNQEIPIPRALEEVERRSLERPQELTHKIGLRYGKRNTGHSFVPVFFLPLLLSYPKSKNGRSQYNRSYSVEYHM